MGGARSAATRPRDVVASAFPQTPASRTLSGHREAASGLHVADGNVTILGKELKACSVTERSVSAFAFAGSTRSISRQGTDGEVLRARPPRVMQGSGANCFYSLLSSPGSANASRLLKWLSGISFCLELNSEPGIG